MFLGSVIVEPTISLLFLGLNQGESGLAKIGTTTSGSGGALAPRLVVKKVKLALT